MDIRNMVSHFNQLENCTVIEGFLLIDLINDASPLNRSFPKLTEVTDYIIIYRVTGLHSLSKIFPNLSVIRGNKLFDGYALVVYSNFDLMDLGLHKLRSITRGGVRIEKNHKLCYDRTIDWLEILAENETQLVVLTENGKEKECRLSKCPGEIRIEEGHDNTAIEGELNASCQLHNNRRLCWNSKLCQTSELAGVKLYRFLINIFRVFFLLQSALKSAETTASMSTPAAARIVWVDA